MCGCLFKMTEQVEQQICIQFCIKFEHSSTKTIWMIQKAAAMGNWWLAASSRQCTPLMPPNSPNLVPWDFWFFLKLKSPLEGKRFQTTNEIQENVTGQLMVIGRTVWGPRVPTLKGMEASLSYIQRFLYLVSSSINVSIFHITWLDTLWTGILYMYTHTHIYIHTHTYVYIYFFYSANLSLFYKVAFYLFTRLYNVNIVLYH